MIKFPWLIIILIVIGTQYPDVYPKLVMILCVNVHAGGGNPNDRALQRMGVTPVPVGVLPHGDVARQQYIDQEGSITQFGTFGVDPLRNRADLVIRRDALFEVQNPSFDVVFSNIVCGNGNLLQDCILNFISVTNSLEQLL